MRLSALVLPLAITSVLCCAEDLPGTLAKAYGLGPEQIRELQGQVAAAGGSLQQKAYYNAFLGSCAVRLMRRSDPKQAEAQLERVMRALEPQKDAESLALLGACLGHQIGFKPELAPSLSLKAMGLFEKAEKANPKSPRVLMFKGIHVLNMPSFMGGGPENALPILSRAVKAAEEEVLSSDPWGPRWGKVESLAWLAAAQAKCGQLAEARANLAKALALNPSHGFARETSKAVDAATAK